MKMSKHFYRIGEAGKKWGESEKAAWLADAGAVKHRSYAEHVLTKLEPLKEQFDGKREIL